MGKPKAVTGQEKDRAVVGGVPKLGPGKAQAVKAALRKALGGKVYGSRP